jgi:hypothetical protein
VGPVAITPARIMLPRVLFGFVPRAIFALATGLLSWRHLRHIHHFLVMSVLATAFY